MYTLLLSFVASLGGSPCGAQASIPQEPTAPKVERNNPALEELIDQAREAREKRGEKPLVFTAEYALTDRERKSTGGSFHCWGPREFRVLYDVPHPVWVTRFEFGSDPEQVLVRMRQLDVKDDDEAIISRSFRRLRWKDAEWASARSLMGLLLFYVPQPEQMLRIASRRYFDLKVIGADREDGVEVWVLGAALPPHEVPEAHRKAGLVRVRITIGKQDLLLRRHQILDGEGKVYQENVLSAVRPGQAPEQRPKPIEIPAGVVAADLFPRR